MEVARIGYLVPVFASTLSVVNEPDKENSRLFDPSLSPMHDHVSSDQLIVYSPELGVSQFRTNTNKVDKPTLVLRIGGACRKNGKPGARAAWSVYFGPGSRYNATGQLSPDLPQTSSRADIESLWQALHIIFRMEHLGSNTLRDLGLREVRILTDSEYLVRAVTMWMPVWIQNEGKRSDGREVCHFTTLKAIYKMLNDMSPGEEGELDIKFMLLDGQPENSIARNWARWVLRH